MLELLSNFLVTVPLELEFEDEAYEAAEIIKELHSRDILRGIEDLHFSNFGAINTTYVPVTIKKTGKIILVHEGFEDLVNE